LSTLSSAHSTHSGFTFVAQATIPRRRNRTAKARSRTAGHPAAAVSTFATSSDGGRSERRAPANRMMT
jgi:hypothetical protein